MEECLYLEHYQILQECKKARKEYDNILEEKAKAYYGTQPQSTKPKASFLRESTRQINHDP